MINIKKATHLIKTDGLFSLIYDDMLKDTNKKNLSEREIASLLRNHPPKEKEENIYLKEFKRLNKENKVSNIQVNEVIILDTDSEKVKQTKAELNSSIQMLKFIEKFEVDPEEKLYYIFTGSFAVGLIFVVHNIVSLYTKLYDTARYVIFGSYFTIVVTAIFVTIHLGRKYKISHAQFKVYYARTQELIDSAIQNKSIREEDLFVEKNN